MKPETRFIQKVHRRLGPVSDARFRQKMEAGNGTPDFYYEGELDILWVEYKVHPNKPSDKQRKWIARARDHQQPVWVVTELRDGTVKVEFDGHRVETMTLDKYVALLDQYVYGGQVRR